LKALFIIGLVLFSLLFCYLAYQETSFWPRASATRTADMPEYVHERYQRSYFSIADAQKLRRLHNEEAIVLVAMVSCCVALAYSRCRPRKRL